MKPTIALFIHQPRCSVQCANGMIRALSPHYNFKIFTKHDIEKDFFDDVDMVAFPGGDGDSESWHYLMKHHAPRIRDFVARGGRYLGICMGAYWAGSHYFDILDSVDAVQYITQPNTCTRRPHAKSMPVTWFGEPVKMYFYDGCALVGDQTKFETVSTYSNGDPMAIIQGRIGIIGCHPEAEANWYTLQSWMHKEWHGGQYDLLLRFADYLMTK
ncbi:Biotin-protein ligase, N-terminal [uncultured Caudovirales phage]|uniref:Biotin-protein ligase, N-terminal n=1 Tax=uncultured Caudovirales phage TaxID=2100421 RepID=A0A6J5LJL0_9CAUD|nr:Biotin-protein ligase, N-terminal [uncultured Caudovirales phage]